MQHNTRQPRNIQRVIVLGDWPSEKEEDGPRPAGDAAR
jgi:hypothetical protein